MHHHRLPRQQNWITRVLRGVSVAAALTWLLLIALGYGPTGHHSTVGRVAFIAFVVATALAVASGTYEHTRAASWLRAHTRRHRIDWNEFDVIRAGWERRSSGS